ncbi:unnamed protein product [Polarella glacialis]|uniref:Sugar phosphate transporter domain-containing protein n=1 Tax=Polarella glacialis TaxID=89957 RepID=A0A813ERC6_POLGL|nr:unnamed protein product [Polarella glacialis]
MDLLLFFVFGCCFSVLGTAEVSPALSPERFKQLRGGYANNYSNNNNNNSNNNRPDWVSARRVSARPATNGVLLPCESVEEEDRLSKDAGISIFVPGVGSAEAAAAVQKNLVEFMRGPGAEGLPWDCKIYVYENDIELPLNESGFAPCEIVRHQGAWMDHWRVFVPSDKPYIVQWLDSIQMDPNVNMKRMIATMANNNLQLISPAYNSSYWKLMHPAALPRKDNAIGRVTDFVEFQVSIFTRDSFRCLQSVIEETPTIHLGWGVDFIFPKLCGARVGIVDVMTQSKWRKEKLYDGKEAGREMVETLRKFPLEVLSGGHKPGHRHDSHSWSFHEQPEAAATTEAATTGAAATTIITATTTKHNWSEPVQHNWIEPVTHNWSGTFEEEDTFEDTILLWKILAVPSVALLVGVVQKSSNNMPTCGTFLIFFGAQSFLTLYMKNVLSQSVVAHGLKGLPAPFAVTGMQQLVSCLVLVLLLKVSRTTTTSGMQYTPKGLESWNQLRATVGLAACFVLNIGLNNLSLSLLDLSVNLAIRSTAPFTALLVHLAVSSYTSSTAQRQSQQQYKSPAYIILVLAGTISSTVLAVAKSKRQSSMAYVELDSNFVLGVSAGSLSIFFASVELVLVSKFVTDFGFKLKPLDTVLHVAVPASLLLTPFVFYYKHPVSWFQDRLMTDWEVLWLAADLNPSVIFLALGSGLLAVGYNIFLYTMVQDFSPHLAALSSNFNKVVTVCISIGLGVEQMPRYPWNYVMMGAMAAGFCSFAGIGFLTQARPTNPKVLVVVAVVVIGVSQLLAYIYIIEQVISSVRHRR